ncbi:MAG: hypothetical protein J7L95_08280, partial [Prolixibacteraceae bacterium]|nr:hypothetical protein [Prolixibacteraceae bacterium]
HTLAYLFLPWSLLFFISAFAEFRFLVKNRFQSHEYFTLTGIWIFFIILNSASSQLPNYIFAIVPLIAVLTAKWIDIATTGKLKLFKVFSTVQAVVVFFSWVGVVVLSTYLFPPPEWYFWVLFLAALGVTFFIFMKPNDLLTRLLLPSTIVFACFMFLMNTHIFPYIFSFQAPPKAARYFNEKANNDDKLYNYQYPQFELFFYSNPQAQQLATFDELTAVAGKPGTWIFTDTLGFSQIKNLHLNTDTIIEYQHLYLNRGGRFINPATRQKILKPTYLIKF